MKGMVKIYCDGGARGNPGPAAAACVVFIDNKIVYKHSKYLDETTNNVAEYMSAKLALEWVKKNKEKVGKEVVVVMDSELVTKQLTGDFKVKSPHLRRIYQLVKEIENNMDVNIKYKLVPRNKNKLPDYLVNETLDNNK